MLTDSYCKGIIATTLVTINMFLFRTGLIRPNLIYLRLSQMKWAESINIPQNVKFRLQGGDSKIFQRRVCLK